MYNYAEILYREIKTIWNNAFIPTVPDKSCIKRIRTVLESLEAKLVRSMKLGTECMNWHQHMLGQLCDLAPPEVELLSILQASILNSWKEDFQLYQNMKAVPQVGCIDSQDTVLAKIMKKVAGQNEEELKRQERESARRILANQSHSHEGSGESSVSGYAIAA